MESTFTKRYSTQKVNLGSRENIYLEIDGIDVIIDLSNHSIGRKEHRAILNTSIVYMVKKGFDEILDQKQLERFILVNNEFGVSVIGSARGVGTDIVIDIISVVDSDKVTNPYGTLMIAV